MNFDYYDSEIIANTSDWNIKDLAPAVAAFASSWFGRYS